MTATATQWYGRGLRFSCTQCGKCCTGPPGTVWFDDDEAAGMARRLGLDEASFRAQYAHKVGRRWSLKERRTPHGYACIFLDRKTVPGKAGGPWWSGIRPTVRSVAMNPIDHPDGGRTCGGKHWATPWGKPTKGAKTRKNKATDKYIIRSRKAKKKR